MLISASLFQKDCRSVLAAVPYWPGAVVADVHGIEEQPGTMRFSSALAKLRLFGSASRNGYLTGELQ